jgi:hypothetical protein
MIRHHKPRRLIEIGSGFSTLLIAQALDVNQQESAEYTCHALSIDIRSKSMLTGWQGSVTCQKQRAQNIPLTEYQALQANDILFVDSSHIVKTGGDLHYLMLDVLPRLNPGVIVHFHDIFLPNIYPKHWVMTKFLGYNEQYFVHAFLLFNNQYEVLWAGHYMHFNHPDKLKDAFESYRTGGGYPGSLWIRRVLENEDATNAGASSEKQ